METKTHEYYVSPEVAKLLKEAGFDWECNRHYTEGRNILFEKAEKGHVIITRNQSEYPSLYFAPTLDVAQRWLREVKGFEVTIDWSVIVNANLVDFNERVYNYHVESDDYADGDNEFTSYEQAQEAGIKKALEIMLEKEDK